MKFGILGGTFDPVHAGHLYMALAARRQLRLDRVIFVPGYAPPHKAGRGCAADMRQRMAMLRTAIAAFPWALISGYEARSGRIVYTVETVGYLRERFGRGNRYFLLIGSDWAGRIRTWKDYPGLARQVSIVACPRSAGTRGRSLLRTPPLPVSSTEIRKRISLGQDISSMVPANVGDYILKHRLYRRKR